MNDQELFLQSKFNNFRNYIINLVPQSHLHEIDKDFLKLKVTDWKFTLFLFSLNNKNIDNQIKLLSEKSNIELTDEIINKIKEYYSCFLDYSNFLK